MKTIPLSGQTFDAAVERASGPVLVDFWAPWCGPCRALSPLLDELAEQETGRLTVAKVNVDENPELAERFSIQSIPTLLLFQQGKAQDRLVGVPGRRQLLDRIHALQSAPPPETARPPLPPFTEETARQKVQAAEDAWNSRDPERVAAAYTPDSEWRNRSEFLTGRPAITEFLRRKWSRELDYRLRKELWAFTGNRIAVRFEYEWHDTTNQWFRSHGNENWEFAANGLMQRRFASINDVAILESERKFRWERPAA